MYRLILYRISEKKRVVVPAPTRSSLDSARESRRYATGELGHMDMLHTSRAAKKKKKSR